ncbi:MAG: tRNA N6-adenosine threonylcarbamoyltransferase [Firmicutes bacterium ADurb.Bin080]|nr:MAG: tRNA N6-adenosine threonylcarbamoyltransferase [Firmicutes bacterium ADurb.Bin080]
MNYYEKAKLAFESLRDRKDYYILAYESSCDETACAVVRGREVVSSVISSQIDIHKRFGGVVPEIASRNHILAIDSITDEALSRAGIELKDIEVVAVTYGAGLLGALLVGLCYGKALAYGLGIPFIGINHIKGHIAANYITRPDIDPPFIALVTSGGHSSIFKVEGFLDRNIEILGETRDDAIGESFDKVARVLGLGYPGGPAVEKLAKNGKNTFSFTRPFKGENHLDFSFSGIKRAVINTLSNASARGEEVNKEDLAFSFQLSAVSYVVDNTIEACRRTGIKRVLLAGGVGANNYLRNMLTEEGNKNGVEVILPDVKYCTDNAAMIGVAAFEEIKAGALPSDLSLDADPSL